MSRCPQPLKTYDFFIMIIPIRRTTNYFISDEGYCIRIKDRKEIIVPLQIINKAPKVKICNTRKNLVYLMIEHFIGEINPFHKISFKIIDNKVPLETIKIKVIKKDKTSDDDIKIFKYNCKEKALKANYRVENLSLISEHDVLDALKRTNFKCFYCGDNIKSKTWHLDHVFPISLGGLNIATNITPSCKECNLMKSNMPIEYFLNKCKKIINNNNQ